MEQTGTSAVLPTLELELPRIAIRDRSEIPDGETTEYSNTKKLASLLELLVSLDEDIVVVSPSTTYNVLKKDNLMGCRAAASA